MKLVERDGCLVADNAVVIGEVTMAEGVNVWYNAIVRGDIAAIRIGRFTNIQDGCVLHVDRGLDLDVGAFVTVGHQAILHGRKVGNHCLIGMQAALLSGSVVGEGSIIGAGAVVREGMEIPPRSLAVGVPAKVIGTVDPEKIAEAEAHARDYYESALRNARSA